MKKLILLSVVSLLCSCGDPKLKDLEAKLEDTKCKTEKMTELLQYDNILAMSVNLNIQKEYDKAFASFSDSTLSCDEANKKWDDFMKLYDSVQKK
jgi:hypothetical protein